MNLKKVGIVVLTAFMVLAFVGCGNVETVSSRSSVTYTISPEIFEHCGLGYNEGTLGPITVTEGSYYTGSKTKSVYLIGLSGTELVEGQSTGYLTDLLSGFNQDSCYLQNVIAVIQENIPEGSNLILAGHSLGGMIAQQVAADDDIKDGYNVLNTVTFGSPLLSAGSREGTVIRLGDTVDPIPYLSGSLFNNTIWAICGLNRENGGYGTDLMAAHCESYGRSDVWGAYDVIGKKNGSATLTLNLDTLTYYQSPTSY
ncbi:MAG: alpha/beta hydrolase [Treponemataceae bacterium]|nr:alpha/beta hydrolase [Treponemataceae bacterium]